MSATTGGAAMSEAEYLAHRRRLGALFALRVAGACAIVYVWDGLDSIQKAFAIAAAVVVVPGLGTLKKLVMPYARYLREHARRGGAA